MKVPIGDSGRIPYNIHIPPLIILECLISNNEPTWLLESRVFVQHKLLQQLVNRHIQELSFKVLVHLSHHVLVRLDQLHVRHQEFTHLTQVRFLNVLETLKETKMYQKGLIIRETEK